MNPPNPNTILIVEDDQIYRNLLDQKIRQSGFNTSLAQNGQEAFKVLESQSIQLILLDLIMPQKGGYTFMYELSQTKHNQIPIIILTNLNPVSYPSENLPIKEVLVKANTSIEEVMNHVHQHLH
jgi:CheY-like chemotaxis protein